MNRFAICTSIYESGRPYLDDWLVAALAAAEGHACEAVVAVHGFRDPEAALIPLSGKMRLTLVNVLANAEIPAVRRKMLEIACDRGAEILIFCDMDDTLTRDALPLHEAALSKADFSYGDMALVDTSGTALDRQFFDDGNIPDTIDRQESIADRNWLGFSNTAVWSRCLNEDVLEIPQEIIAVDWWLFAELLSLGRRGQRASGVVAHYRQHDENSIGARAGSSGPDLSRRLDIMRRHYVARAHDAVSADRLRAVSRFLRDNQSLTAGVVANDGIIGGVWFEGIRKIIEADNASGQVQSVTIPEYAPPSQVTTRADIMGGLRAAGVVEGDILMPHVSIQSMGMLVGGVQSVLDGLYDSVGAFGTIIMPAFTGGLTDPSTWFKPPVPKEQWDNIRDAMPAFDPMRSPSSGIGGVAEMFRVEPGTLRSSHPVSSFTARGLAAAALIAEHPLEERFGPASPLGRFCEMGGKVALIGAPNEALTLLHLTSYFIADRRWYSQRSPILQDGRKVWVSYRERTFTWHWFDEAFNHLVQSKIATVMQLGDARLVVLPAKETVQAIIRWRQARAESTAA